MNYQKYTEPAGGTMTSSSQAGSRNCASHTALQEKGSVRKTNATCGRTCLEQYEKLSQSTWWGKMFGELLVGTGDWYSTRCKLTWKLKVTPSSRAYFQLAVSTLPIDENEFGLLPTATASDFKLRGPNSKQQGLPEAARAGLLPTPTTQETPHPEAVLSETGRRISSNGNSHSLNLIDTLMLPTPQARDWKGASGGVQKGNDLPAIALKMLPTPTASEMKDSQLTSEQAKTLDKGGRVLRRLGTLDMLPTGSSSQLNPRFVGEMMGFSVNWTELPFLSGEAKASKPTETPSYPL